MPPRKRDGVVAGELKSPCASSQRTNASGRSRASTGSVVTQIEQCAGAQDREARRRGRRRTAARRPRAGSRATSRRSSSNVLSRGSPGVPTSRGATPARAAIASASARVPSAAKPARSDVRQSRPTTPARRRAHRPFHSGSRFSKNALTPSWMSSVENASVRLCAQQLERVHQRQVLLAPHRVLAQPHQQRRLARELRRPVGDRGVELVGRRRRG